MRQGLTDTTERHRIRRKTTGDEWANAPWFGPYTMEELNARIDRAEAEFEAGEYYTCEEVHRMLEEEFPWLK